MNKDKFDRLELRIEKYYKYKELLDDCFNIYELAEKAGISYRAAHHVIAGTRNINYLKKSKRDMLLSQGRKYLVLRKAVLFYCPRNTARILKVNQETIYNFYRAAKK